MAHIDKKKKLRPSVLDRLLDDEPHNRSEVELSNHQNLKKLRYQKSTRYFSKFQEYEIEKKTLKYRYTNIVDGFDIE